MSKKAFTAKTIGGLIAAMIIASFATYLVYSNIISYTLRYDSLAKAFIQKTSCSEYQLSDEMLRDLTPQTMSEFNLFCKIAGGNIWENNSSVICFFSDAKNNDVFCSSDLASKLESACNKLDASWLCLKKEISCRCE